MSHQIAMRISQSILALAGIAIFVLVITGSIRAVAAEGSIDPADSSDIAAAEKETIAPVNSPGASAAVAVATAPSEPIVEDLSSATASPFVVKRVLEIDEPFVHGYYKWDDAGVPDGEIVITVDLKAESMSVFKGGYEIGATVIKFGDALKPTPTGVFPITQKSKDHISNIYDVPMPYMLRLTNDGIAIHAAEVKWGHGTRGCIGVPHEFARLLFEQVKLGDRVIVTNGRRIQMGDPIVAG